MAQQVRRQMNYVDGTAARQMYAAPARRVHEPERKAPSRRVAPQQRPQERPKVRHRVTAQTKKTLAFSAGYMLFMAFMSVCWFLRACGSWCLCSTYQCFYLCGIGRWCRCRCACEPLFWCQKLWKNENNSINIVDQFSKLEYTSECPWILLF